MSSEDEDFMADFDTTEEILLKAASIRPIPAASRGKYDRVYEHFFKWNKDNKTIDLKLLMVYFRELALKSKPTSLWAYYSMLKATLKIHDNVDISSWTELTDFLKDQSVGYQPKKAKSFTEEQIEKFISEAPDESLLDAKVVCIFVCNGIAKANKLMNVMVEHVKQYDDLILVTIPKTDATSRKSSFIITGTFFETVKKYIALRPKNTAHTRFFLTYRCEKCIQQPIGRHKFNLMPQKIAKFLKLPDVRLYNVNSFRKTSAIFTNSNTYLQIGATDEETKNNVPPIQEPSPPELLTNTAPPVPLSYTAPPVQLTYTAPPVAPARMLNAGSHVCALSCAEVKCATEENEWNALHAFNVLKPSDFVITEVIPTEFPTDPTCRWIVSYRHVSDPISSENAEQTFEYITRSIPHNVRVYLRFIRKNTTQVRGAYVIVYSVNCRCRKQPLNDNGFVTTRIKCEI